MVVEIEVGGRVVPFTLDFEQGQWRGPATDEGPNALPEADFPLVAVLDGKRYELYSDNTFAEVE